jgi:hypothetical protein
MRAQPQPRSCKWAESSGDYKPVVHPQDETKAHAQMEGHRQNLDSLEPSPPEASSLEGHRKPRLIDSLGTTEIRRVAVIELKPEDRARLQRVAKRYRVTSLARFFEGCLSAEDRHANPGIQVLFRIYDG